MKIKIAKDIDLKLLYFLLSIIFLNGQFFLILGQEEIYQPEDEINLEDIIHFDQDEIIKVSELPTELIVDDNNQEVKIGLTMSFPIIGDIVLYPEKNEAGKEIFRATLDKKKINLDMIDVSIDNFSVILSDNMPQVSADVSVFGKRGNLTLVELSRTAKIEKEPVAGTKYNRLKLPLDKVHFRIKFIDKLSIDILPSKSVNLNYIDLIIQNSKEPILATNIDIFATKVNLAFAYSNNRPAFELLIPKINLGNFFSELKNTQFDNINLRDLLLKVSFGSNDLDKKLGEEKDFIYSLKGSADFSPIKLPGIENISLNDLSISGSCSLAKGLQINSTLSNFDIVKFSRIKNAEFGFYSKRAIKSKIDEVKEKLSKDKNLSVQALDSTEQKILTLIGKEEKPLILISCKGDINLPKIGGLNFDLGLDYSSDGLKVRGLFGQPINYGNLKINAAQFDFNTNNKNLAITGNAELQGFALIIKLDALDDPKDPNNKIYKIEATTEKKEWAPFKDASAPDFIKKLNIKKLSASVDVASQTKKDIEAKLILNGEVDIFEVPLKAQAIAIKNTSNNGVLLKAEVNQKELPAAFDKLPIEQANFVVTSIEYKDLTNSVTYEPNTLTLLGKVNLTGILEPISKIINNKSGLSVIGNVNPSKINDSKLSIQLSNGIPMNTKVVSIGPASVEIGFKNAMPEVGLKLHLLLYPEKDQALDFSGLAQVSATLIGGQLRLDGMWKDPFGLKGIEVGDLNVALGINPQTFAATLTPAELKLGGRLVLAPDKVITLAIAINYVANQLAFLGSLESKDPNKPSNLSIKDIVVFIANRLNANIPEKEIPVIEVQDPKFSFASQDTDVGAIKIPMGIVVNGKLLLLSKELEISFGVSKSGVMAKASMSPIVLGPLKLTAGKTASGEIRKTKHGGPQVDIELTMQRQIFLISGLLEIDSIISGSGDMQVSKNGINFNFEVAVGSDQLFLGQMKGQSKGSLSNPGFDFTIIMKQKFIDFANEYISQALKEAEKELKQKIGKTVDEIKKLNKEIDKHKKDIENAQKEVEKKKNDLEKINKASKEAETEINKWKNEVKKLQDRINKNEAEIKTLSRIKFNLRKPLEMGKNAAKIGALKAENLGIKASMKVANVTLENIFKKSATTTLAASKKVAQEALNAANKILQRVKKTNITVLEASRDSAIKLLKSSGDAGVGVLQGTNFILNKTLTSFNIREFKLENTLDNIKKGELFQVTIDMQLLSKNQIIKTELDLKNIKGGVAKISKEVTDKFRSMIKV